MMRSMPVAFLSAAGLALGTSGCTQDVSTSSPANHENVEAGAPSSYDRIERSRFNQLAVQLNLPLYWAGDLNQNRAVEPNEVVALRFYPTAGDWVADGAFTPAFKDAYESIVALDAGSAVADSVPAEDRPRREAVIEELDQSHPVLMRSDLSAMTSEEKSVLSVLLQAGDLIDKLFAHTLGAAALANRIPVDDMASQSLFRRNWGPRCLAPKTVHNPACSAIPGAPKPKIDVYPEALVDDDGQFCKALEARSDADALLAPFVVVRGEGEALTAVPYTMAYREEMTAIAAKLDEAAATIMDPSENALRAYLAAAAGAFRDNTWELADEAWAKMNATNSKWYLRIAPDETYWDPCSRKAGFHTTLARINLDSLSWQDRLVPLRQEMEDRLAALAGTSYQARTVAFHMPDFIDIVANFGDDRNASGALAGQSLPNWGPVANEGRGRTMVMTNLDSNPDRRAMRRTTVQSLLAADTMRVYTDDAQPQLLTTILHEATHNLGPSHEYKVNGLTDAQIFGGTRATVLEELKAEVGAIWYLGLLVEKGIITPDQASQAYTEAFIWALEFLSLGLYTNPATNNPYTQLSAIEVGFLGDEGAVRFDPEATAANGTDKGAFVLDCEKLPGAVDKLMRAVVSIKATGDAESAQTLKKKYVDEIALPVAVLAERFLRQPFISLVYSITY